MSKPPELEEAELVYRLCQAYQSLPEAGGVLDQSVELLHMVAVLDAGGHFDEKPAGPTSSAAPEPAIPMQTWG